MTVHFIGAGPGAPDLLTLRAARLISECPVCLYAGSLVPEGVLAHCPPGARIINTAPLSLDQIMERSPLPMRRSGCGAAAFGRPLGLVGHGRADAAAARHGRAL
jgi:precorrin-4 methylase